MAKEDNIGLGDGDKDEDEKGTLDRDGRTEEQKDRQNFLGKCYYRSIFYMTRKYPPRVLCSSSRCTLIHNPNFHSQIL